MSFYGSHPDKDRPKVWSHALRREFGLPPCKQCTYADRVFHALHLCTRCSGDKTLRPYPTLVTPPGWAEACKM